MTKYEKFRRDFEASGLNQKEYAATIGKTPSSVHYMLKRASSQMGEADFYSIEVREPQPKTIVITLVGGTKIELPI